MRRKPHSWSSAALSLALILGAPASGAAQLDPASEDHPFHDLAFLEGSWTGELDGTLGPGVAQRRYRFVLGDRFLLMTHDRDPQEAAPQDDEEEEWVIFSFDTERERFLLREFLAEGVVNEYACELAADGTSLACEGEAAEGGSGLSLRLRYEFADPDHFTERFEIFGPDGSRKVRIEGRWRRTAEPR